MKISASAYPWDVIHLGADRVVDDFVEQGIDAVDLAAAYHPIDALSPREGFRLYTCRRGAVHFPARPERYGRIKPSMSAPETVAAWPQVVERARGAGIAVNAWTVTLFQPWIVDAHPDTARVLASGDAISTGVCPANDDMREYLGSLCLDVVDQFGVETVRLESIMPLGYNIDWLRPRVLVEVSRLARELLTLCFCESCVRRGTGAGLDVERLRRLVRDAVVAELGGGEGAAGPDLGRDTELQAFLAQHEQASIELAAAVRTAVGDSARIAATIRTSFPSLRRGVADSLTAALAEVVDQLSVAAGGGERNRAIAEIAQRASHPVDLTTLFLRGARLDLVAASGADSDGDPLAEQLDDALALGVAEAGLYNYGLLRDDEVRSFMDEVRAARARGQEATPATR